MTRNVEIREAISEKQLEKYESTLHDSQVDSKKLAAEMAKTESNKEAKNSLTALSQGANLSFLVQIPV